MGVVQRVALYTRTARHLRWEQLWYRPIRRLQHRFGGPPRAAVQDAAEARIRLLAREVEAWGPVDGTAAIERARDVVRGRYRFLNHVEDLPQVDWSRRYVSHLWSYNLHYFDYARDLAWAYREIRDPVLVRRFEQLAGEWLDQVGGGGGDGWEPYALSLRVVNWTYALLLFGEALRPELRQRLLASIATQSAYLERRQELHILGNHLQKNLKALAIAGLLYEGAAAKAAQERAVRALWKELDEQVLPDGGHFERSPMYHCIALGDFLETLALLRAVGIDVPQDVRARVERMVEALSVLTRRDGRLHLFNDAAEEVAPPTAWLRALAGRVLGGEGWSPAEVDELPSTGYFSFTRVSTGDRLVIDCGPPGPSYQPGHAHCDLLSFELDLHGYPAVVDSGTSGYGGDPFRAYARSTRAHNTVQIGTGEQSEVWGDFRVGRRATVLSAETRRDAGGYVFRGSYRPYHTPGSVHHRRFEVGDAGWSVTDRVEGAPGATLRSYVHLHPRFAVEAEGNGFVARSEEVALRIDPFGIDTALVRRGELQPLQGWYLPQFGRAVPAPVLELSVGRNTGGDFGYRIAVSSRGD